MSYEKVSTLADEKVQAKRNAKQLGYLVRFPNLTEKIEMATTITEVHRLLATARKAM